MPKKLSDSESELWIRFVREVRPLRSAARAGEPASVRATSVTQAPAAAASVPPLVRAPVPGPIPFVVGTRGAGLDDTRWRGLATGRVTPTRRLDLHGHTVEAAFRELGRFLAQASLDGIRCVEIITGHGRLTGGGAIRRELPYWLNRPELRTLIVAGRHPDRSNAGAMRLLLRRRRDRTSGSSI